MNTPALLMAATLILSGCAMSSKTYTPDGREGYSIDCSGTALSWGKCLEKAGALCGARGYEVLERSGDAGGMTSAGQYGLFSSSVLTRTMLITCK